AIEHVVEAAALFERHVAVHAHSLVGAVGIGLLADEAFAEVVFALALTKKLGFEIGEVQHGCTGQIMKKMIERFWFLLMISLYRKSVKWICYKFEETVNDEKYPGMMSGQEREV
ncbi:MAG: hypothetical protein SPL60_06670, partial [Lachnospiraceae bacterium]|nr:hypothetical protein [Lachnospiraceae bacterium]